MIDFITSHCPFIDILVTLTISPTWVRESKLIQHFAFDLIETVYWLVLVVSKKYSDILHLIFVIIKVAGGRE